MTTQPNPLLRPRRAASRRDVFWCFGISILMSILAVGIGIIRTQQLADQRVRDNAAQQHRETVQLTFSLAASNFDSCVRGNTKDKRLLDYVDSSRGRSLAALRATLASTSATDDQKRTALRNYAGLVIQSTNLRKALSPEKCVRPTPTTVPR